VTGVQTCALPILDHVINLARENLEDLLKICHWNERNGIKFYRITSGLCPHITNSVLIQDKNDYKKMAYPIEMFSGVLKKIGAFARKHKHRITMHPDPFISIGTENPELLTRNKRELYYHARILDLMSMDMNSTITIHGGGIYGDKLATMKRWVRNFDALPLVIKRRIILENDEFTYSILDTLWIAERTKSWSSGRLPVVFDIFHYACYNIYHNKQKTAIIKYDSITELSNIFPRIIKTWENRRIKMHISEQAKDKRFGAHSDYITEIPHSLLLFPKKYSIDLDLMLEAKAKEYAYFKVRRKYAAFL
jgi:UV DNA damage endonuclease